MFNSLIYFLICIFGFYKIFKEKEKIKIVISGTMNYIEFRMMSFLLQRYNLVPEKINGGYIIPYIIGTEHYHMFVEDNKTIKKPLITKVIADGNIFTDPFKKLLGHNGTLKNSSITPSKLGFENIEVYLVSGKKRNYSLDDLIDL